LKKNEILVIGWILVFIAFIVFVGFIVSVYFDGYRIYSDSNVALDKTGQFGDFIGGVVGTILSAAGFIFLYVTLIDQRQSVSGERFESKFFELLKLHRDNVTELSYTKDGPTEYRNREVIKVIFEEFWECLKEVRLLSKSKSPALYMTRHHITFLLSIKNKINPSMDLVELAQIDIAYSVVFFGLEAEGEIVLRDRFRHRYRGEYFYPLLKLLRLKPKRSNTQLYRQWDVIINSDRKSLVQFIKQYYEDTDSPQSQLIINTKKIFSNLVYEKYYGGHHYRLGHYLRHLFQSYKYLNEQTIIDEPLKYFYGKTLRAQLSTYEQFLIFINSLSTLGMNWEFTYEPNPHDLSVKQLQKTGRYDVGIITRYNLLKNLPGNHYFGISYRKYYPNIEYETTHG